MKKMLCFLFAGSNLGAFAGGFQINTQGPVSTGMAGAFTGISNDASAVFYNPGALAFNAKTAVLIGGSLISPGSSYLSPYNGNINQVKQLFTPFYAYGTFKINDKISGGLGINTPFGLGTKWADNWEGKFLSQEINLSAITVQPTVSYKINEMFSVGGGFVFTNGSVSIRKAVPVSSANSSYGGVELKGSGYGYGYNLGIMGKFGEQLSVGLNYRSSSKLDLKNGDAVFSNIPGSLSTNFPSPTKFNSKITLPYSLTVGLGYKCIEKLLLTAELGLTGWSSYDSLSFDFPSAPALNTRSARKYQDVFVYRFGAQYVVHPKFKVRGGIAYDTSPVQDGYLSPELPDANKIVSAVGLTYTPIERLGISACYTYENLKERSGTNTEANFSGTYKTIVNIVGLGINYNFN